MKYTREFIREIPKTDLHVHLDGSLRLRTLIDLAKAEKVHLPSYEEEGLRDLVFKESYQNLGEYLHGFMYTTAVLRNPENLARVSYELARDNQNEGVRYMEVRFAPQLHMDGGTLTMDVILEAVNDGLKRAQDEYNERPEIKNGDEPPFKYGIIVCAMRMFGESFSPYYGKLYRIHNFSPAGEVMKMAALELARAVVKIRDESSIPIVGFDLAGQEDGFPAEDYQAAYDYVHRNFMHKTVHAGEAYGAESIFQAITDLHADRLGHAYYLLDSSKIDNPNIKDKKLYIENLINYIAEQRITIEVCLTSNFQTNPELKNFKQHSFKEMMNRNLSVTLCTDNRLVSNTTVSKEIEIAVNNFEIAPGPFKNLVVYGFKRNFYPGQYSDKRDYSRQCISYYEKVATKHGVDTEFISKI
jgi:adenosine deaminase